MATALKRARRGDGRPSLRRAERAAKRRNGKAGSRASRYEEGFAEGYRQGMQLGAQSFPVEFEGTSIVIPTYNQLGMLKQCIRSILEHTDSPYEIVVVDNASKDGTGAYLAKLGGLVRYRTLPANLGFAGAVNMGMMMAKGTTIALLNNDTLATRGWLDNMLACLNSDDGIGMVGPETNFIGGDQQIKVPYVDVRDLPAFAEKHNRPDPGRWRPTDRLVGFCLLFRRDLFRQVGYFDEGFELGNFEDDDFNVRVRMLGKRLAIAGDAFVHHFGSVSMQALGSLQERVYERNRLFFAEKWHNPYEWIHRILHRTNENGAAVPNLSALYPRRVLVRGLGESVYWVDDDGSRRPLEGATSLPVVRLSQVDLLRLPAGEPIAAAEAEARWNETSDGRGRLVGTVRLPDGTPCWIENGKARCVISTAALRSWMLHERPMRTAQPEELAELEEGLPIIPLPVLKQNL